MAHPGVVAVWSGWNPRLQTYRLDGSGARVLGRDLADPEDDRISLRHARVTARDGVYRIEDLGSRNGTYMRSGAIIDPIQIVPPVVVRTGRSVWVVVDDVQPYENARVTSRHGVVVARSLRPVCDELDEAIREESSVAIAGPRAVVRKLAMSYVAATRNGRAINFDASAQGRTLDEVLSMPARTIVLEHPELLSEADRATLVTWLETDVRVVTCVGSFTHLWGFPQDVERRLAPRQIQVPHWRFDELPHLIHQSFLRAIPGARIHASVIERSLVEAFDRSEDAVLADLELSIRTLLASGETKIRGEHLTFRDNLGYAQLLP